MLTTTSKRCAKSLRLLAREFANSFAGTYVARGNTSLSRVCQVADRRGDHTIFIFSKDGIYCRIWTPNGWRWCSAMFQLVSFVPSLKKIKVIDWIEHDNSPLTPLFLPVEKHVRLHKPFLLHEKRPVDEHTLVVNEKGKTISMCLRSGKKTMSKAVMVIS